MSRNIWIILVVILIILGGAIIFTSSNKKSAPTPTPTPVQATPTPQVTEKIVTLSEQNKSGVSGSAVLREENGKVTVTLNLTGSPKTTPQPAHIHIGACPKPGNVKYPLTNVVDGQSVTPLDVTLDQLKSEQPLAINVHKSATQASIYVACGDLTL